jgi:hypothetical protein
MVAPPRAPLRADRLRALNVPQLVAVECDEEDRPRTVGDVAVEAVLESWRIDDEWWRLSITRCYHELLLDGGKRVVLFEDVATGEWFAQMP